ncbi:MAG: MurR/RpiR family transcriptional regulator [Pseudomonadota bacterium]
MAAGAASVREAISTHYASLTGKQRSAADFIARNPLDVATRSLRRVAADASISPATFSRLARQIGFPSYEDLREASREDIGQQAGILSEKAKRLQSEAQSGTTGFLGRQSEACVGNIDAQARSFASDKLEAAADALDRARRVIVLASRGSAGLADYFCYMGNWVSPNWSRAERRGGGVGQSLVDLTSDDIVFVIVKVPFANRSVRAAALAAEAGATVMLVTDSHTCPALQHAAHQFIVPTESPQFFPSYAATVVLLEVLIGMLVARGGKQVQTRIQKMEEQNQALDRGS